MDETRVESAGSIDARVELDRLGLAVLAGGAGVALVLTTSEVLSRVVGLDLVGFQLGELPVAAFAAGVLGWGGGAAAARKLGVPSGRLLAVGAAVSTLTLWGVGWCASYLWDLHAAGLSTADTSFREYVVWRLSNVTIVGGPQDRRLEPSDAFFREAVQGAALVGGAVVVTRVPAFAWGGSKASGCRVCGGKVRKWTLAWLPADPEAGEAPGLSKAAWAKARALLAEAASGELDGWNALPAVPKKPAANARLEISTHACVACGAGALWLHGHEGRADPGFLDEVPEVAPTFRARALEARPGGR